MGAAHSKAESAHPRAAANAEEEREQYLASPGGQAIRDAHVSDFYAARLAEQDLAAARRRVRDGVASEEDHVLVEQTEQAEALEADEQRGRDAAQVVVPDANVVNDGPVEEGSGDVVGRERQGAPSPELEQPPSYESLSLDGNGGAAEVGVELSRYPPRSVMRNGAVRIPVSVVDPGGLGDGGVSTQRVGEAQAAGAYGRTRTGADDGSDSSDDSGNSELSESLMMNHGKTVEQCNARMGRRKQQIAAYEQSLLDHGRRMQKKVLQAREDERIDAYIDKNPHMADPNITRAELRVAVGLPARDQDYRGDSDDGSDGGDKGSTGAVFGDGEGAWGARMDMDRSGFLTEEEQIQMAMEESRLEYEQAEMMKGNVASSASEEYKKKHIATAEEEAMFYEGAQAMNENAIESVIYQTRALTEEEVRHREEIADIGEEWYNEARKKMIRAMGAQPVRSSNEEKKVLRVVNATEDQALSADDQDGDSDVESFTSLFEEAEEEADKNTSGAVEQPDQSSVDKMESGADSGVEGLEAGEDGNDDRGRPGVSHYCRPIDGWGPASRSPSPDSGLALSRGPTSQKRPTRVLSSSNDPNDAGQRRASPRRKRDTHGGALQAYRTLHGAMSAPPTTKLIEKMVWQTPAYRPALMPRIHQALNRSLQNINTQMRGTNPADSMDRNLFGLGLENFVTVSGRVYAGAREIFNQTTNEDEGEEDAADKVPELEEEEEGSERDESEMGYSNLTSAERLARARTGMILPSPDRPRVIPPPVTFESRRNKSFEQLKRLHNHLTAARRWDIEAIYLFRKLGFKREELDELEAVLNRQRNASDIDERLIRNTEASIQVLCEEIGGIRRRLSDCSYVPRGERKRVPSDEEREKLTRELTQAGFQNRYVLRDQYVIERAPPVQTPGANARRLEDSRRARNEGGSRSSTQDVYETLSDRRPTPPQESVEQRIAREVQAIYDALEPDEGSATGWVPEADHSRADTPVPRISGDVESLSQSERDQALRRALGRASLVDEAVVEDDEDLDEDEEIAAGGEPAAFPLAQMPIRHPRSTIDPRGGEIANAIFGNVEPQSDQAGSPPLSPEEVEGVLKMLPPLTRVPSRRSTENREPSGIPSGDVYSGRDEAEEPSPSTEEEDEAELEMFPPLTRVQTRRREFGPPPHLSDTRYDSDYEDDEDDESQHDGFITDSAHQNAFMAEPESGLPSIVVSNADATALPPLVTEPGGRNTQDPVRAPSGAVMPADTAREVLDRRIRMLERYEARNRTITPGDSQTNTALDEIRQHNEATENGPSPSHTMTPDRDGGDEGNDVLKRRSMFEENAQDIPSPRRGSTPLHWQILDSRRPTPRLLHQNRTVTQRHPRRSRNNSTPQLPTSTPPIRARSRSGSPRKKARTKLGLDGADDYEPYITDEPLWDHDEHNDAQDEQSDGVRNLAAHARYSRYRAQELSENIREIQALQALSLKRTTSNTRLPTLGMPSNTGMTRQAPSPSAAQQQQQVQQQQQQNQQQQPQSNGLGGALPNGVPHAGHQTDINYLWGIVQELSDCLAQNRAETAALVERVQTMRERDARANVSSPDNGNGNGNERHVNGDTPVTDGNAAAEIASLRSQLHATQTALAQSQAETLSLANTNDDYVAFLHGTMDKLRTYAHGNMAATIAIHTHYNGLLEQEREANLQLRLEHGEWQKGLGRASEWARKALRERQEECGGLERRLREQGAENRVLRGLVGWKVDESDDEDGLPNGGGQATGQSQGQAQGHGVRQAPGQGYDVVKRGIVASNGNGAGGGTGVGRGGGVG